MFGINLLGDLLVILGTAFVFGLIARRLKLPSITGYVVGGAVVSATGLIPANLATASLIDFGVILLLFTLGIEFSFRRLARVKDIVFWGASLQIISFSLVLSFLLIYVLNLNWIEAIFLSLALSLSSTAIAVKELFDKGEVDTLYGEILTGWLLLQDLAVIPIWVILPIFLQTTQNTTFNLWALLSAFLMAILKTGVIFYLIYWLGKKLVPLYLNKVAKTNTRELFLIAVVLLIAFLGALVSYAGLSWALGAFLAGLLISETTQNHAIFAEIRPLRDILTIVFFVSLGLLLNLNFLFSHLLLILALVIFIMLLKLLIVDIIMVKFGYHSKTIFLTGLGLLSVGEFAFVLGRYGLGAKLISEQNYNLLLSLSVVTMIVSPCLMLVGSKLYHAIKDFVKKFSPFFYHTFFTKVDQQKLFDQELPLSNHVVICGHGRVGKHISQILDYAKIPYIVIDFNQKIVSDLKKHGVNVIYGDPSDIEVLDYAQVDKAKVIVVAVPDRHSQEMIIQNCLSLNREVIIVCRSHFEEDKDRLYALGAHAIIQPEFEAALHMSGVLLNIYKLPKEETLSYLNKVRKEN